MEPSDVTVSKSTWESRKALWAVLAFVIVVLLAGGVWQYVQSHKKIGTPQYSYSSTSTPYDALVQNNTYFVQAQAAATSGNYQQAQQLYEKSITTATDLNQQAQIEYTLAQLEAKSGDPVGAVDLYQKIVANPAYGDTAVKAYSVMSMAELYYQNGDPAVTKEIFKSAPYSSLRVQGNLGLSYRKLEQYAVSFYPVGISELRIANWYASNITDATSTPDGSATSTYPALINSAIALANADVNRTKSDAYDASLIPDILVRKEALLLTMYQAHIATAQDTEQACEDAINMFASIGEASSDGYARYYYAVFLSLQGPSRVSDLQTDLAPFYSTTVYNNSSVFSFFALAKNNSLGQKARFQEIASLDPKFKALLVSLGWSQTDF